MLIYANVTKYLDPDGLGNLPAIAENKSNCLKAACIWAII
jgi:hypothetical protein